MEGSAEWTDEQEINVWEARQQNTKTMLLRQQQLIQIISFQHIRSFVQKCEKIKICNQFLIIGIKNIGTYSILLEAQFLAVDHNSDTILNCSLSSH